MKIHLARFNGKRVIIGQVTERCVIHTHTHIDEEKEREREGGRVEDQWISWSRRVARDIIGLLMNLSEMAISLHGTGRSISPPEEKQTRTRAWLLC